MTIANIDFPLITQGEPYAHEIELRGIGAFDADWTFRGEVRRDAGQVPALDWEITVEELNDTDTLLVVSLTPEQTGTATFPIQWKTDIWWRRAEDEDEVPIVFGTGLWQRRITAAPE